MVQLPEPELRKASNEVAAMQPFPDTPLSFTHVGHMNALQTLPLAEVGYHGLSMIAPAVDVERAPDGTIRLASPLALQPPPVRTVSEWLPYWAERQGQRGMLGRRGDHGGWDIVSWAMAWERVQRLGSALLAMPALQGRPLMALSGNSIEFALLKLAADYAGITFVAVSPSYSLSAGGRKRLGHIARQVKPGMVFVQSGAQYGPALAALECSPGRVIAVEPANGQQAYATLCATRADTGLQQAHDAIQPDAVSSIFFTSGSTGGPKGVLCTHRMLTAAQQMAHQLHAQPVASPVYLDWLPWHHAFGGMANFARLLRQGAMHYIDDGRPTPDLFQRTLANLMEISPTALNGVPLMFSMLAPALERSPALANALFSPRLESLTYGGAGMSRDVWERIQRVAIRVRGSKVPFLSGLGATETSSLGVFFHWSADVIGNIGLPLPGCALKLVPMAGGDRYELRMRGPHVFSSYLEQPALSSRAFDEEGYYRLDDAVRFVDAQRPVKGLRYDGRVKEDFKLSNGTWVVSSQVRAQLLADLAPLVQDIVLCGRDQPFLAALVWLDEAACRTLAPGGEDCPLHELAQAPAVLDGLRSRLERQSAVSGSTWVRRLAVQARPPAIELGEVTDKGYVSQLAVLESRAAQVEALYGDTSFPGLVTVDLPG